MCGVTGFYTKKNISGYNEILSGMLQLIAHRGTDNRGICVVRLSKSKGTIGIGHNRLSVIDLSKNGNQPYTYKDFIIAYNGEIYNYLELRKTLLEKGYKFDSTSDTEVIIKLFDFYGNGAFEKLNGMFAIVIYNKKIKKLYLIRDRMGVKPLLYYNNEDSFLFSSELKSFFAFPDFKREISIDKNILANYFKYGYVNSFRSVIEGVQKVENGSILTYDLRTRVIEKLKYWDLKKQKGDPINNIDSAEDKLYELLKSSISLRLVADIPVGLFLSSGIDSNLVLNFSLNSGLDKLDTYTLRSLDYEENELTYDNRVIRRFISSDKDTIWKDYKFLCSKYDEPFSDPATIGLYQLSKFASSNNKVIMVGDGGDELLAGYSPYKLYANIVLNRNLQIARLFYKFIRPLIDAFINSSVESRLSKRLIYYHSILSSKNIVDIQRISEDFYDNFTQRIVGAVFSPPIKIHDSENSLLSLLNYKTSSELIHQLNYKTDIAGMLNTVEIREPLLDYRLFEFQQRFSPLFFNEMVGKEKSKYLFRKILLNKLKINIDKLQKKGFHIGLESVFKENIDEIDSLISSHKSDNIDMDYVKRLWSKWKVNKVDFTLINRIVTFLLWEKNFNEL